jgi:cobalt/nickel transport system permease protein
MLNFSVQNGTSGHLMGSVLAMALLGVPYAIISMAVVLTVQSVFFADGGINALGANVINMAFIGVGCAGFIFEALKRISVPKNLSLAITAWVSIMVASTACSLEVAAAGAVSLNKVLPAMLSVHALIGIGEIAITGVILAALSAHQRMFKANKAMLSMAALVIALTAAMLSPFASNFPDGLEYVSERLAFMSFSGMNVGALFPDYQVNFIANQGLSTICAGLAGVAIVSIVAQMAAHGIKLVRDRK